MYGSPPVHGVLLVSAILSNPDMKSLWIEEVKVIITFSSSSIMIYYITYIYKFWYVFNLPLCCQMMVNRIQKMRMTLQESLENLDSPLNWEHITNQVCSWHWNFVSTASSTPEDCFNSDNNSLVLTLQVGLFFFSCLTPKEVEQLAREFHIFMTHDGRISMGGVTTGNVNYLANAIHDVTRSGKEETKILCNVGV